MRVPASKRADAVTCVLMQAGDQPLDVGIRPEYFHTANPAIAESAQSFPTFFAGSLVFQSRKRCRPARCRSQRAEWFYLAQVALAASSLIGPEAVKTSSTFTRVSTSQYET